MYIKVTVPTSFHIEENKDIFYHTVTYISICHLFISNLLFYEFIFYCICKTQQL